MAGTVYMPGIGKVQLYYSGELHDIALNTFYMQSTGFEGASAEELATFAAEVYAMWNGAIVAHINSNYNNYECAVSDWASDAGLSGSALGDHPGGDTDPGQGAQVAWLLNMAQSLRYRGGHPRLYIPAIGVSGLATNTTWSTDFLESVQPGLNDLLTALNTLTIGGEAAQVVNFRTRAHVGGVLQPPSFTPIESFTISPFPATIRRRVRRAGHRA